MIKCALQFSFSIKSTLPKSLFYNQYSQIKPNAGAPGGKPLIAE